MALFKYPIVSTKMIFKYLAYNWPEVASCLVCHKCSFFCFSFLIFSMLDVLKGLLSTYSHFYFFLFEAHLKNYSGLHKLNLLHVFFDYESPTLHCNEIDIKQLICDKNEYISRFGNSNYKIGYLSSFHNQLH